MTSEAHVGAGVQRHVEKDPIENRLRGIGETFRKESPHKLSGGELFG